MSNFVQVFYVSKESVQSAASVGLTSVDLYFYSKPKITGNKSGITAPGVEVTICKTVNGTPSITPISNPKTGQPLIARREYMEIQTSLDSSVGCNFKFDIPVPIDTDNSYGIVIKFDGNEDFMLWQVKVGEYLIGTTTIASGPSGKYVGNLYQYNGPSNADSNSVYLPDNWKPFNNQDLKFGVSCARYFTNGIPNLAADANSEYISVSGNTIIFTAPVIPTEFITFDAKASKYDHNAMQYGDTIYQDQAYYPAGAANSATCAVVANTPIVTLNSYTYANSVVAKWNNLIADSSASREYIVIKSLNHYGANQHAIAIRKSIGISADGLRLFLDEEIPFSNNNAKFFKAPVGFLAGLSNSYISGNLSHMMTLTQSNANSSVRFVNNCITDIAITAGGTGYTNTDFILVTGYENVSNEVLGGYPAIINLRTNANGTITSTYTANAGAGFVNGSSYSIRTAANGTSSGTGATLTLTSGCKLYSEFGQDTVYFGNCSVINIEASQITPQITIDFPNHTQHDIRFKTMYYAKASSNTYLGKTYLVDPLAMGTAIDLKNEHTEYFSGANTPVIASRSNQFVIGYANGALPNTSVIGSVYSNVATYSISATSENDFSMITITPEVINSFYAKYSINNDYTNEHTDYGNAISKHITSKITLEGDQRAEDLLVYVTAFRPPGTDLKVYSRVFNSQDNDAFDDKDWSLLECVSGNSVFSNPANTDAMYEYTYNFPAYPNTDFTFSGTVTCNLSSTLVTGVGTTFTANLAVNDLIKIYSPLFPNTNYTMAVVNSIANATSLTISTPIANAGITGAGLKVDRIKYPHQVFNNIISSNVARYYDSSMAERDTFDSVQVKLVLLSNNQSIVPRVEDLRAVAVTA